jgi:hypothetical protein
MYTSTQGQRIPESVRSRFQMRRLLTAQVRNPGEHCRIISFDVRTGASAAARTIVYGTARVTCPIHAPIHARAYFIAGHARESGACAYPRRFAMIRPFLQPFKMETVVCMLKMSSLHQIFYLWYRLVAFVWLYL